MKVLIAAAIAALGIALAPIGTADAAPKFCDNHGFGHGQVYKHACATGPGGTDAEWATVYSEDGTPKKITDADGVEHTVKKCKRHCGGGRHGVETHKPW